MLSKISAQLIHNELREIHDQGRYRIFRELITNLQSFPKAIMQEDKREVILWCSNDYLALGHNQQIATAMQQTLLKYGSSSGGTRNISGTHKLHVELEAKLAKFHNKPSALIFNSGYMANLFGLSALIQILQPIIYSDAENHNSIINAIRFAQIRNQHKIKKRIFTHNSWQNLRQQMQADRAKQPSQPMMIVCESIYSMSGDFAPLSKITKLAQEFQALLYVDEVHAVGLYGANGSGYVHQCNLQNQVDMIQGTLGKSIGQIGGYLAGDTEVIDVVRSTADGFIFTTSLPPHVCTGALNAIMKIEDEFGSQERNRLHKVVQTLRDKLHKKRISILESNSHIIVIMVRDAKRASDMSHYLLKKHHCYIPSINYPTVAKGSERLRICVGPRHTENMIEQLIIGLQDCQNRFFI